MKWFYAIAFPFISIGLITDIVFLLTDIQPVREYRIVTVFALLFVICVQYSIESIRNLRSESE